MIRTCLTDAFNLSCPVISEGMPFAGHPRLAAAVSNAGGMGFLGAGVSSPARVAEMIRGTRRLTRRPFGVNISSCLTTEEVLKCCVHERPAVVAFTREAPGRGWIDELRAAGVAVWAHVASPAEARLAAHQGADAVIIDGALTDTPPYWDLVTLLPAVADVVHPLPMIAAGGITDGRRLATVLALGADAGWCGTRFLASREVCELTHPPLAIDKLAGMPFEPHWTRGDLCGTQGRPQHLFTITDMHPLAVNQSVIRVRRQADEPEFECVGEDRPIMSAAEIVHTLSRDAAHILANLHASLSRR